MPNGHSNPACFAQLPIRPASGSTEYPKLLLIAPASPAGGSVQRAWKPFTKLPSVEASLTSSQSILATGLENIGNTCFLNSTLQCLVHAPPVWGYLRATDHRKLCTSSEACVHCELCDFIDLYSQALERASPTLCCHSSSLSPRRSPLALPHCSTLCRAALSKASRASHPHPLPTLLLSRRRLRRMGAPCSLVLSSAGLRARGGCSLARCTTPTSFSRCCCRAAPA